MDSADPHIRARALSPDPFEKLVQLHDFTASPTSVAPSSVYNTSPMADDATTSSRSRSEIEEKNASTQSSTVFEGGSKFGKQRANASAPKHSRSPVNSALQPYGGGPVFGPWSISSPRSPGSPVWNEERDGDLSGVYSMEDADNSERKIEKLDRKLKGIDEKLRPLLSPKWKPASSPISPGMATSALPEPTAFKPLQWQRKPKRVCAKVPSEDGGDNEASSMGEVAETIEPEGFAQRPEERPYSPSYPPYSPTRNYPIPRKSERYPSAFIDLTEDDEDISAVSKEIGKSTDITRGLGARLSTSSFTPKSPSPSGDLQLSGSKRKRPYSTTFGEEEDEEAPMASRKVAKTAKSAIYQQSVYPTPLLTPVEDTAVSNFIDLTRKSTASPPSKLKRSHADAIGSSEDEQATSVRSKVAKTTEGTSDPQFYFPTSCFSPVTKKNIHDVLDLMTPEPKDRSRETTPFYEAPRESYFHRLPAELRNRIYRYVGHKTARIDLPTLAEPALARAFTDLKDEMSSVMFMENKFRIPIYTEYRTDYTEDPLPKDPVAKAKAKQQKIKVTANNSGFEVGTLALEDDHWLHTVDPRFQVIKHIGFRIMESHAPSSGYHRHICDYFLNIRTEKGKTVVTHTKKMMLDHNKKTNFKPMCDLALEKAKKMVQQEGFVGFNWEQMQELAASFVSVKDAKSRITRRWERAKLKE